MGKNEFLVKLTEILQARAGTVGPETPLLPSTFDSLAILSTIAAIDEEYGITAPAAALARCRTVAEVLAVIAEATAADAGGGR